VTPHNALSRIVTRRITDALEEGVISWWKEWMADPNAGIACNLAGIPYQGINAILLQMAASEFGYRSR